MKFYSETLKQFFDTEAECLEAEKKHNKKLEEETLRKKKMQEEKEARAKEVEDAYQVAYEARKDYIETLNAFLADYGSYKTIRANNFDDYLSYFISHC